MGILNRRNLFGTGLSVAAALAVPAVSSAQATDGWDALISALAVIHPDLARMGKDAKDAGYSPSELQRVFVPSPSSDAQPFLEFRREYGPYVYERPFPASTPVVARPAPVRPAPAMEMA